MRAIPILLVKSLAMASVEEMVAKELSRQGHKDLVDYWRQICALYEEGGPNQVESYFVKKVKEIRSTFTKEFKEIETGPSIVRAKKTIRRRR